MSLPSFFCFLGGIFIPVYVFNTKIIIFYYLSLRDFLINLNDSCYVLADVKKSSYLYHKLTYFGDAALQGQARQ